MKKVMETLVVTIGIVFGLLLFFGVCVEMHDAKMAAIKAEIQIKKLQKTNN